MKLLVATKEGQGKRKNDFSWCDEGELVMAGFECDRESVDGACGCKRALVGVSSNKATTTMKVAEVPLTVNELKAAVEKNLKNAGWINETHDGKMLEHAVEDLLDLANCVKTWPLGTIVEKRGNKLQSRV